MSSFLRSFYFVHLLIALVVLESKRYEFQTTNGLLHMTMLPPMGHRALLSLSQSLRRCKTRFLLRQLTVVLHVI